MRLRLGRSYWLDVFGGGAPRLAPLRGERYADIAIIGGGITGCAAALLFARAGAKVVLVDRGRIGRGSTAASTALLMQEPDADFLDLARRYGASVAARVWRCARSAVRDLRHTLAELDVPTARSLPSIYFTFDAAQAPRLMREVKARRRARLPACWLDQSHVRGITGLD
jgi:glycine/D-amino acid oxidase-like deaminating enzyme